MSKYDCTMCGAVFESNSDWLEVCEECGCNGVVCQLRPGEFELLADSPAARQRAAEQEAAVLQTSEPQPHIERSAEPNPFAVGRVFGLAERACTRHYGVLVLTIVGIWTPLTVLVMWCETAVLPTPVWGRVLLACERIVDLLVLGIAVSVAWATLAGQSITLRQAIRRSVGRSGHLVLANLLRSLVLVIAALPPAAAYFSSEKQAMTSSHAIALTVALSLPGIYLFVRMLFVDVIAVGEGLGGIACLRRSFSVTAGGRFWQALSIVVLSVFIGGLAIGGMVFVQMIIAHWIGEVIAISLLGFVISYLLIVLTVTFVLLRDERQPATATAAMAQLDNRIQSA